MLHAFFVEFTSRITYLVPALAAALLIGEPFANLLRLPQLRAWIAGRITRLNRKLNRKNRSVATRLYRGMVATAMVAIPALALGIALMRPLDWVRLLSTLLLVALIGSASGFYSLLRTRRAAKQNKLALQTTEPPYLFPDSHALLRYRIAEAGWRFLVGFVGGALAFLLADMPGLLFYYAVAACAFIYSPRLDSNRAFGWAAASLFFVLNIPVRLIGTILLWIASWVTPGTRLFRSFKQIGGRFDGWFAALLGLSSGGRMPSPAGELNLPWTPEGNPKPTTSDFARTTQLILAASLIWICLLGSILFI